jgi:carbamoyl-phosphate synthase large subunit
MRLIDKALMGWKEYELELWDKNDNVVIICSIENMDPMGIHTGDSITVAPAMTYQIQFSKECVIMQFWWCVASEILLEVVTCSLPFRLTKRRYRSSEINPRVSRSSALASKATGYPIARFKISFGIQLRWIAKPNYQINFGFIRTDFGLCNCKKYHVGTLINSKELRTLGLQMKSVGEVMGIGRSFQAFIKLLNH